MSAPAALVDSHCHVAEPEFDGDRDAVLARAAAAGVTTLVCVGATGPVESNAGAVALAGRHGGVRVVAAVGIHPHHARSGDDDAFARLEALTRAPGVVAVGETGLDFHYNFSPPEAQRVAFARTVDLARRSRLPLVVHVREAQAEAAEILRRERAADVGGVIHCFTGDAADARRYLDLGFHVSVSGIATFRNAQVIRDAVAIVPRDRLLVETDAPYLAPVPHRGRRNEPAWVVHVAEAVATVWNVPLADVAGATSANALRLFALDADPGVAGR